MGDELKDIEESFYQSSDWPEGLPDFLEPEEITWLINEVKQLRERWESLDRRYRRCVYILADTVSGIGENVDWSDEEISKILKGMMKWVEEDNDN